MDRDEKHKNHNSFSSALWFMSFILCIWALCSCGIFPKIESFNLTELAFALQCQSHSSCVLCTNDPECVWCLAEGHCTTQALCPFTPYVNCCFLNSRCESCAADPVGCTYCKTGTTQNCQGNNTFCEVKNFLTNPKLSFF